MRFHVALHPPHLVLQTPAGTLERMVHRKWEIGQSLIGRCRAADSDFPSVGQRQMNVDLVEAAAAMMGPGRLDQDAAGGQSAKAALQLGNVLCDSIADGLGRIHPVKFDLYRSLHDGPRLAVAISGKAAGCRRRQTRWRRAMRPPPRPEWPRQRPRSSPPAAWREPSAIPGRRPTLAIAAREPHKWRKERQAPPTGPSLPRCRSSERGWSGRWA